MFEGHEGYSPKSLHKWIEENKEASTNTNNETAVTVTNKKQEEDKLAHVY
jgi:hypothetical protein